MHLLLLAECRLADIPIRAAHVPLQITVSDGGEDGRVEWMGGAELMPYFPSRLCIFQSKAQNLTEASVEKEIIKKRPKTARTKGKGKSKKKSKAKRSRRSLMVLSAAISEVVKKRGAYAILSSMRSRARNGRN